MFCKFLQCLIVNCSAHRRPTETGQCSLKRPCPKNFKKYKTISVGSLWAEQSAIKHEYFFKKSNLFDFLENSSTLITNCSAHRLPTEIVLYFFIFPGQGLFREHWLVSVGFLWAEQFVFKHWAVFSLLTSIGLVHYIYFGILLSF